MRIVTDIVDLAETTFAARALQFTDNELGDYFPTVTTDSVDYRLGTTDRFDEAATVRAFDTPATMIGGGEVFTLKGGLPAVSAMQALTETDLIRARRLAGADLGDSLATTAAAVIGRTTKAVQNRYEIMRGQALTTGGISINEAGVVQSVDFSVPAANRKTRAVSWTDIENADIFSELSAWVQSFVDSAGEQPGAILTSTRVRSLFARNKSLRAAVFGNVSTAPSVITSAQIDAGLAANGLPPIRTYDRQYNTGQRKADGTPVRQRVIPDGYLGILPAGQLGETQMGLTEEAVTLAGLGVLPAPDAPGMVAVTYVQDHPVARFGLTTSIGLPIIQRPEALIIASVL